MCVMCVNPPKQNKTKKTRKKIYIIYVKCIYLFSTSSIFEALPQILYLCIEMLLDYSIFANYNISLLYHEIYTL